MAKVAGKFSRRAQDSSLGRLVDEVISTRPDIIKREVGSELDFIESAQGLNLSLYPLQRLIVKATFGIPIDYKPIKVPIWDIMKEKLLFEFTEEEAVHYLYNEGLCNVQDWRDIPPRGFSTVVGYAGRRGGKSEIVASISGAHLRNLLMIENPQKHYKLAPGSPIDFSFMGTDDTGAQRIYSKLRSRVNGSPFYTPYIRVNNVDEMQFVTEADRANRDVLPSINVKSYPCTTQAARGPSNYFLALDEFQFFRSTRDTNSSDMYKAATPSTAQFAPVDDPERPDSKVLVISSPAQRVGKMYDLHTLALSEGVASGIFTIRLSTVLLNPRIPRDWLRKELKENPDTFKAEVGGEFLDGAGSYVPPEKFNILIQPRQNLTRFSLNSVGRKFFWGLDYGTKHDATALAIGHMEMRDRGVCLIYDYIDRMMVGEAFTGPGVLNGERVKDLSELDLPDILAWLVYMQQVLPCFKGATDQHGGTTLKQLLHINGINTFELVHLTESINSKMYMALKGFIDNSCAEFPDVPKFKTEFNNLEAEFRNKYVLRVEAPSEKGAHDDMADAVALVAYQAQQWLESDGNLDLDPSGRVLQVDPRILNPTSLVNPNDISLRDLQIRVRQERIGDGLMLPVGLPIMPRRRKW